MPVISRIILLIVNFFFSSALCLWMLLGGVVITAITFGCLEKHFQNAIFFLFFFVVPVAALFGRKYSLFHVVMKSTLGKIIIIALPAFFIVGTWGFAALGVLFDFTVIKPNCP